MKVPIYDKDFRASVKPPEFGLDLMFRVFILLFGQKTEKRRRQMDDLKIFYECLPHSLRRNWCWQMWKPSIISGDWPRRVRRQEQERRYLDLLKFGLESRFKALYGPLADKSYPTFLWNLAQAVEFREVDLRSPLHFNTHNADRQLRAWLDRSFLDFPLPEWCYGLWKHPMSRFEVKALCRLGQGVSPRDVLKLSKQENCWFHQLPERFSSLSTGCCFCILRSHRHSTAEAMAIAEVLNGACRYLEWPVFLHVVRTVSEWLACQKFTLREFQIPVYYWRTQGLFDEHFTLKNRSFRSVCQEADEWLYGIRRPEVLRSWPSHGFSWVRENPDIIFDELLDSDALFREGRQLHHCVGSYQDACRRGCCAIVSMRSLDGKLCATLEIELPGRILVQVKESCNRQPSAVVRRHIKAYVEAVGLIWKKSA